MFRERWTPQELKEKIDQDLEGVKKGQRPQAPYVRWYGIPIRWVNTVWRAWLRSKNYQPQDLHPGESRHTNSVAPPSTEKKFGPKLHRGDGFR